MAKKKSGGGKNKPEKELTKAQRIEAKKAKQAQKGAKKDRKQIEEEDIEVILAEFLKKEALKTQITVEACGQPSPRANFTLSALQSGEMIMFGGEYFDGDVNVCFNDVFKWNIDAGVQEWKMISSPNSPPPRCSHQAVVYRDHLYVFGGEFATADQFHHYRDFWRLDLKTNAWEAIEEKGGPSPRSGHRMVVWRNYLVVFGGFYEAARETKWFNDLYLFSFVDMKWKKVSYPVHKLAPAARSGCQLAVHPSKDIIFVYGGYAKVKNVGEKSEGKVYSDLWALNMSPVLKKQDPTWEKLSRKGQAPSPRGGAAVTVHKQRFILFGGVFDEEKRRHTMQSTFYNDLFVYDMDRRRWFEFKLRGKKNMDGKRRRKKKKQADGSNDDDNVDDDDDSGDEEESDDEDDFEKMLENQFGYVDEDGNLVYIDHEEEEEKQEETAASAAEVDFGGEEEESKEEEKEEEKKEEEELTLEMQLDMNAQKVKNDEAEEVEEEAAPAPCPRINPTLIIRGSTLYVYGGVVEDGDREITLDDCWSLDLKRLDEWKLLLPGTMSEQVWKGEVSETEESSDGDDDDESDEDDDDDFYGRRASKKEKVEESQADTVERAVEMLKEREEEDGEEGEEKKKKKKSKKKTNDRRAIRAEMEKLQEQLNLDDINRTPQMGENLRDFFARTANYWSSEIAKRADTHERQLSIKEIKREGFSMAEERYNELLPILERLNVLEQEQKEAEELHQTKKKGGKDKGRRS
ncbi:Protein containing repeated kelch motif, partial [Globisporangium splendens]